MTRGFKHHSPLTNKPPNQVKTYTQQPTQNSKTNENTDHEQITTSLRQESELPPDIWAQMTRNEKKHYLHKRNQINKKREGGSK